MVEDDPVVYRALLESRELLGAATVEPRRADAIEFLRADDGVYDVVFLDPPFKAALWPRLAALLPPRLAPGALVYYEGAAPPELPAGWEMHRQGRAGQVSYQLLRGP
jgi:16S rRNA (guanine966-N2)-methyltransferase